MLEARLELAGRLAARADQWFTRSRAAVLESLPCRRGCHHCCIGPFEITVVDVDRLQQGLRQLPEATRSELHDRARVQVETIEAAFPQLRATPFVDGWHEADLNRLVTQFEAVPCPALEEDGGCGVYPWRPATCRLMGIPVERGGQVHGACQIQTSIPILRLPEILRQEEADFAQHEAGSITALQVLTGIGGEEVFLPYGFLPGRIL